MERPDKGMVYLNKFPASWKWVNQCVACQRIGLKPALPSQFGKWGTPIYLRKYLGEMTVDDAGLCSQCAAARPNGLNSN
jgi:hypothetical protein